MCRATEFRSGGWGVPLLLAIAVFAVGARAGELEISGLGTLSYQPATAVFAFDLVAVPEDARLVHLAVEVSVEHGGGEAAPDAIDAALGVRYATGAEPAPAAEELATLLDAVGVIRHGAVRGRRVHLDLSGALNAPSQPTQRLWIACRVEDPMGVLSSPPMLVATGAVLRGVYRPATPVVLARRAVEGQERRGEPQPAEAAATRSAPVSVRPNPGNPAVTFGFVAPRSGPVQVSVYDVSGRLVFRQDLEVTAAGAQAFTWSGVDTRGRGVGSGVYAVRIRGAQWVAAGKATILK